MYLYVRVVLQEREKRQQTWWDFPHNSGVEYLLLLHQVSSFTERVQCVTHSPSRLLKLRSRHTRLEVQKEVPLRHPCLPSLSAPRTTGEQRGLRKKRRPVCGGGGRPSQRPGVPPTPTSVGGVGSSRFRGWVQCSGEPGVLSLMRRWFRLFPSSGLIH